MSIEIRPTAVTSQIEEKARILRAALRSLDQVDLAISSFSSSGDSLKGAGYDAARSHMSQYTQLVDAVRRSINATLDADGVVRRALGDFGGAGRVSEAEWREKLDYAERQISSLQAQARSLVQSTPPTAAGLECELMSINGSVQAWRRQANEAGRVLSHIYGYCAATNGAHEGRVEQINAMAAAGAARFAGCGFSVSGGTVSWDPIDEGSWFNRGVYDSCAPFIERVYGDVSRMVLDNPVADSIADWWEENGTWVTNVGKIAFGLVAVVGAFAAFASGVGIGMALLGLVFGGLDAASGIGGLVNGKDIAWDEDLGRGVAGAVGADKEAGARVASVITTAVSLVDIGRLPQNAGRLIKAVGSVDDLAKPLEKASNVSASAEKFISGRLVKDESLLGGRAGKKAALVHDICEVGDSVGGIADVSGKTLDAFTNAKKERSSSYAKATPSAAGFGC